MGGAAAVFQRLLLLLSLAKAIHSHSLPHRHLHQEHDDSGEAHNHDLGNSNGDRDPRMLAKTSPGAAHEASAPSAHAPSAHAPSAPAPPPKPLRRGFDSREDNDTHCGSPRRTPSLSLAKSIFMDLLQNADNLTFLGNMSHVTAWRSEITDPSILPIWSKIRSLSEEYFNLTLPENPFDLLEKLPKVDSLSRRRLLQTPSSNTYTVPVYFTVVTDPTSFFDSGEEVTLSVIREQMTVLNSAFLPSGFTFELTATPIKVEDPLWYSAPFGSQVDILGQLKFRKGGPESLNVYVRKPTVEDLEPGKMILGIAMFPEELCVGGQPDSASEDFDGVTIYWKTLPTMSSGYLGATLVHETGHWLGLMHTFNQPSSCDKKRGGDGISETAVEYEAYSFNPRFDGTCNLQFDSCPGQPGYDPINNYMDYSPDECYTTFVPEQTTFMQANYYYLRQKKQCSYPGQVSPYTAAKDSKGTRTHTSAHALQWALSAYIMFVVIMGVA